MLRIAPSSSTFAVSSLLPAVARLVRRGAPIAAAVIPLMVSASGCAAESQATSDEEHVIGTSTQAQVNNVNQVPLPLSVMQSGQWTTDRVHSDVPFFFEGYSLIPGSTYDRSKDQFLRVKQNVNGGPQDVLAIFNQGMWFIDSNADQMHEADDASYFFGGSSDIPVSGNWSSSGIGSFNGGTWYIDSNGDGRMDLGDATYHFGSPGDIPVVGDWTGDGKSKIGVFNGGAWALDWNGNGRWDGGEYWNGGDVSVHFGGAGDTPVAGPWGPGREAIGVFNKNTGDWYLDTNGDGRWEDTDAKVHYGMYKYYGGIEDRTWGAPIVGDWRPDTAGFIVGTPFNDYAGLPPIASDLMQPLSVQLRNSLTDPSSVETISYETEYLASVEYICEDSDGHGSAPCPRSYVLEAGAANAAIAPGGHSQPVAHAVTVVGNSPLRLLDTNPPTGVWDNWNHSTWYGRTGSDAFANPVDGSVQLHAKAWYAAPSDNTLARWIDEAKAQADILTRAQSYYQLTKDYQQMASFNHDQLNAVIVVVQGRYDSATNPIDKRKWKAILDSLTATRDAQPVPVPASQLTQYLKDLVDTAKADMLLQADRARAMLAMFDKAQADLEAAAASAASEIGRLRDGRKGKLTSATSGPASKLRSVLAVMPNG